MTSRSVATNALVATVGRVVSVGLGIVITALLTRSLGIASFGVYTLVLAYGSIVQLVADMGLYLTLTRQVAEEPSQADTYVAQAISLRLALVLVIVTVAVALAWRWPTLGGPLPYVIIVCLGLAFQTVSQLLMGLYQIQGQVWKATIGDVVGRLVQVVGMVMMSLRHSLNVPTALALFTLSTAISLGLHRWLLPGSYRLYQAVKWQVWRHLLVTSWPLGLMLVLNVLYFRIDTIILSIFRSSAEVGLYGLAYRSMESALFFPAMLGGLLLPRLSRSLRGGDRAQARQWLTEGVRLMLLMSGLIIAIVPLLARGLVIFLAGAPFAAASSLLSVLMIALVTMFLGTIFGFTLIALHRQRFLLGLYSGLLIFNLLSNLWLIPLYGAVAAAWTTVLTELLSMGSAAVVVARSLSWRIPLGTVWPIGLATALTSGCVVLFPAAWHVVTRLVLGVAVYGAWSVLLRTVSMADFTLLVSDRRAHL